MLPRVVADQARMRRVRVRRRVVGDAHVLSVDGRDRMVARVTVDAVRVRARCVRPQRSDVTIAARDRSVRARGDRKLHFGMITAVRRDPCLCRVAVLTSVGLRRIGETTITDVHGSLHLRVRLVVTVHARLRFGQVRLVDFYLGASNAAHRNEECSREDPHRMFTLLDGEEAVESR